jgi:hypothetical protein
MRLVLLAKIKSLAMSTIKGLVGRPPQERSRQAKLANGRWDTAAQENQPKQLRGCDTGYALATGSCEEANSMDACTVTASDVIIAFAVPNPNYSSQSSRFFQVWLPQWLPPELITQPTSDWPSLPCWLILSTVDIATINSRRDIRMCSKSHNSVITVTGIGRPRALRIFAMPIDHCIAVIAVASASMPKAIYALLPNALAAHLANLMAYVETAGGSPYCAERYAGGGVRHTRT